MRVRRALFAAVVSLLPGLAVAQGDPSFNLVNRSGQTIHEIYVSAVTQPNWGRDLLGQDVLANGRSWPVRIAPSAGCQQDVRVVYADGRPEERRNVNTCVITQLVFGAAAAPTPAPSGGNASFNLVNHGRQPMREIYVSSARDTNWGAQRLPRPMAPGAHLPVQLPAGDCVNDIRIIWSDGRSEERRQVDTCRITNLVFQ